MPQTAVPDDARRRSAARRPRVVAGAAGAVGLALALLVGPSAATPPASALGRLPSCDLGDVLTVPRGYDDWSVTLVDRLLRVEADYVPPDLVRSSEAGIGGGGRIRAVAADDTRAMAKAAAAAGAPIAIWSGYRSYREQVGLFTMYTRQNGFDSAITYSQRPGHSEHQLGLGVDFMSAGGGSPLPGDWGRTPAGAWMRENSWRYGWVNSYPRGKGGTRWSDRTCFRYEPWHYRYLGREVAAKVHESGLTIREYLWRNHTLLDRTGRAATPSAPAPTPTATPTTGASPSTSAGTTTTTGTTPPTPDPDAATPTDARAAQEVEQDGGIPVPVVVAGGAGAFALGVGVALARRRRAARAPDR
jgi:D-alanyl-D-alanine carboxypeptidase